MKDWLRDVKLGKYCSYFTDTLEMVTVEDMAVFKDYSLEALEKDWDQFTTAVPKIHRKHLVRELANLVIT